MHFASSTISELEAQLDYERLRREKLEAQLDQYRREIAYLNSQMENMQLQVGRLMGPGRPLISQPNCSLFFPQKKI